MIVAGLLAATWAAASAAAQADKIAADQLTKPQTSVQAPQVPNGAGGGAGAQQLRNRAGDPLRVSAPPANAVDACDAYLAGRAPAPQGVDCRARVEAAAPRREAGALEPTTIAESGLTARSGNVLPDAQDVARRLAAGDLTAAAVVQAAGVGQGGAPPAEQQGHQPQAPSGGVVVTPPGK